MARGGKRPGSGRKPKAQELQLIERMDAILTPDELWQAVADRITKSNDMQAAKLWAAYRLGQPKETVHQTTDIVIRDGTDFQVP